MVATVLLSYASTSVESVRRGRDDGAVLWNSRHTNKEWVEFTVDSTVNIPLTLASNAQHCPSVD